MIENRCILTFDNGKQLVVTVDESNLRDLEEGIWDSKCETIYFFTVKNEFFNINTNTLMSCIFYKGIDVRENSLQFKIIHNVVGSGEKFSAHTVTYDITTDPVEVTMNSVNDMEMYSQLNNSIQIFVNPKKIMYLQFNK